MAGLISRNFLPQIWPEASGGLFLKKIERLSLAINNRLGDYSSKEEWKLDEQRINLTSFIIYWQGSREKGYPDTSFLREYCTSLQ